jgi:DNA-binding NarL/FixJ family response regulator
LRRTQDQVEIDTATRLGASLWRIWERRRDVIEGRAHLEHILALAPGQAFSAARCSVLTGAGVLAALLADYDLAIRHSKEALAGWRQLGDQRGIARALLCLVTVARYRDDYARAETLGQETLAAFRSIDDRWGVGHVLANLGMVAWVQGHHAAGTAHYEEALVHLRDVGDEAGIFEVVLELGKGASDARDMVRATTFLEECLALSESMGDGASRGETLNELGVVAYRQGEHPRASVLFTEAAALAQENGDRRQFAWVTAHHGDVAVATGDIGSAVTRYAGALTVFLSMGNRVGIAQCLEAFARCAMNRGHDVAAVRLVGSSSALFSAIGVTPPPDRDPATNVAALKSKVSPAVFARAWNAGLALSSAEAAAEALALAAELALEDRNAVQMEAPPVESLSAMTAIGLTPREIEVLRLLAAGMSDREIATSLSISGRTAGNHVQHAMQKIGVESRTAAAVFAVRHHLDERGSTDN